MTKIITSTSNPPNGFPFLDRPVAPSEPAIPMATKSDLDTLKSLYDALSHGQVVQGESQADQAVKLQNMLQQIATRASKTDMDAIQNWALTVMDSLSGKAARNEIPTPATTAPMMENKVARVGDMATQFARADHGHERLTSVTGRANAQDVTHTIKTDGKSPSILFTRAFSTEPSVVLTPVKPPTDYILLPFTVDEWIMGTGTNAGKYIGAIMSWQKLSFQNTLLAVTVLNTSVVAGSNIQSALSLKREPAAGLNFICTAIMRSD